MKNNDSEALGYWCSWVTQNYTAEALINERKSAPAFAGDQGTDGARWMMNEKNVFDEGGWIEQFPEVRENLYFLLDDGWDVPCGASPWKNGVGFGSLIVNDERFPSVKGLPPKERLKRLNERVKSKGWKGLGIWVAARCDFGDACGDDCVSGSNNACLSEKVKEYWRERVLWSKYAGVRYWKVDWGDFSASEEFRGFLTLTAQELFPELVVEHAACCPPLNGFSVADENYSGRFESDKNVVEFAKKIAPFSEVIRSYDVLAPLCVSSTLDRLAVLLPMAKGYINAEDELYIAAALGCQVGVMRNEFGAGRTGKTAYNGRINESFFESNRLSEIAAVVRWQKIAPPFAGGTLLKSDEVLFDDYYFEKGETWCGETYEKHVKQGAPCVISRNAPLPEVLAGASGNKPFCVASEFKNGAYAVCVLPRVINGKWTKVGGEITCAVSASVNKIAVFGKADKIIFKFGEGENIKSAKAISLLKDGELLGEAEVKGNEITVTSDLIKKATASDKSAPALVINIEK